MRLTGLLTVIAFAAWHAGPAQAQTSLEILKAFERGPNSVVGRVIEGSDGRLYGVTSLGGFAESGTIYAVEKDGSGYTLLHEFDCFDPLVGCRPASELLEASDGYLYGVTSGGGSVGDGTLFRIAKDGSEYTLLHSFVGCCGATAVIEGDDGMLYGVAFGGGRFDDGAVFRVARDGSAYNEIHEFRCGQTTNGCASRSRSKGGGPAVIQLTGGTLAGTTGNGGAFNDGILFALNTDGTGFSILHDFECPSTNAADGCDPTTGLLEASDGLLYGTTFRGLSVGEAGNVWRINPDGSGFTALHGFDCAIACITEGGVIEADDGALYGTTRTGATFGDGAVYRIGRDGSGFSIRHAFECGRQSADGCRPYSGVIQASDGALYGTAFPDRPDSFDTGNVYRLQPDGSGFGNVLSLRCGLDGCEPEAPLTDGGDGFLYGTTREGGARGAGSLYRIGADGSGFGVVHAFECSDSDGCLPDFNGVILGSDGMLYGTTHRGGLFGNGTVYRVGRDGSGFETLHSFDCAPTSGFSCFPRDRLFEASDGRLYGAILGGGIQQNSGLVFSLAKDGTTYQQLHVFDPAADGSSPNGTLVEDAGGQLFGTTKSGGPSNGGTLFGMNPDGSGFAVLHAFAFAVDNGYAPNEALLVGSDGALYGTTQSGGAHGDGTVFRINPDGSGFAVILSFNCDSGERFCRPFSAVIEGSDGALYGTLASGAVFDRGAAYRVNRDGSGFEILESFPCGDFALFCRVESGLVEVAEGVFAGTSPRRARVGDFGGAGLVFRLTVEDPAPVPPSIAISSPGDGEDVVEGDVVVEGIATDDSAVAGVTVNGVPASIVPTGNPDDPAEIAFSSVVSLLPGQQLIVAEATDDDGNVATASVMVVAARLDHEGPVVSDLLADPNPSPVDAVIRVTAEIDDTGTGGSPIAGAQYTIDAGPAAAMSAKDGLFDAPTETVFADIAGISEPGVYEVCVIAADLVGNASAPVCTFVVVFDPDGGFVTGGGWIDVPAGAYPAAPSIAGTANFGFNAKYKKNSITPSGSTQIQFQSGSVNFHSLGYDWLTVSAADNFAQYSGTGTVNGGLAPTGFPYRFLVQVYDGEPDAFRMRIWWETPAGPTTLFDSGTHALDGGSIVIHTKGN